MSAMTTSLSGATLPLTIEQRAVASQNPGFVPWSVQVILPGAVSDEAMAQAMAWLQRRHGVLTHAFGPADGFRGWRQQPQGVGVSATEPLLRMDRVAPQAGLPRAAGRTAWCLTVHPLAADAGGLHVLAADLARALGGRDQAAVADEEPFQYEQFIAWRQDLIEDEGAAEGRAYWAACLRDHASHESPRLAWRRDDPVAADGPPVLRSVPLDAATWASLRALANEHGLSPESLLQSAWWALLARLGGTPAIIGGWRHDCRQDYEVMAGAAGVFDKVLPVFATGAPDATLLGEARRLDTQMQAHIEAQEHWPADEPPTRAHLVAGFSFDDRTAPAESWPLQQDESERLAARANAVFEWALHVQVTPAGVGLTVSADPRHHTAAAVEVLLSHGIAWLSACLAAPARPWPAWAALPGGPAIESPAALPAPDLAGCASMAERWRQWADRTPSAQALASNEAGLSYDDLRRRVNRLAHWMMARGVGPGALVAIGLPRSPDGVIAMLASWQAGAAYLPLDPEWPQARQQAVLADARPVLRIDEPFHQLDLKSQPDTDPAVVVSASDVAYVLYTSGSTGTPKGVVIEHAQLLNYAVASSQAMGLSRARRWALSSTVAADLGHTALFGALYHGAALVMADAADMADGAAFARFMARHRVDALKIVPSHLEALMEGEAPVVPSLLVLGGEAASPALLARIVRQRPDAVVYNHYGPTETTVGVMVHALDSTQGDWAGGGPPLSTVLAGNRVQVLDPVSLAPQPVGVLGELCVSGAQVCRGYLNRAAGERFTDDPRHPGDRLYRTGDLACLLPDGGLRLAGRLDHQLKVRGFRIEPAEIESALLGLPGVRQAVVMAVASEGGDPELHAFVMPAAAGEADSTAQVQALRDSLAGILPAPLRPTRYRLLDEFPRLGNGKVDRQALSAFAAGPAAQRAPAASGDDLVFVLAAGMAALLGLEGGLADHDDFFELGGHSLQVIKLVARVRKLFKLEIAPGLVFDHPSPAALAAALRACAVDQARLDRLASAQRQLAALTPEQRAELEQRARLARQPDGAAALAHG